MIVCSRGRQPHPQCGVCHARPMMRLCDHEIDRSRTCSRPLCVQCAIHVGLERDYCPTCWELTRGPEVTEKPKKPKKPTPDDSWPYPKPKGGVDA